MEAPLAKKHKGMRISAEGMLGRMSEKGSRFTNAERYTLGELLGHLGEVASRYYSGDVAVVDEFLQLYCLDEMRPAEATK